MPYRRLLFADNEIYHVFNKSVANSSIFITDKDNARALALMGFYRFSPPMRYSHYSCLSDEQKKSVQNIIYSSQKLVDIFAFALMPNHFHFLLKQHIKNGIPKFISTWQNSYARYFNTKNKRKGSLFCEMFKAVRIENREQFIHVSRYIHLNPVTSFLLKINELAYYPYNSFCVYAGK